MKTTRKTQTSKAIPMFPAWLTEGETRAAEPLAEATAPSAGERLEKLAAGAASRWADRYENGALGFRPAPVAGDETEADASGAAVTVSRDEREELAGVWRLALSRAFVRVQAVPEKWALVWMDGNAGRWEASGAVALYGGGRAPRRKVGTVPASRFYGPPAPPVDCVPCVFMLAHWTAAKQARTLLYDNGGEEFRHVSYDTTLTAAEVAEVEADGLTVSPGGEETLRQAEEETRCLCVRSGGKWVRAADLVKTTKARVQAYWKAGEGAGKQRSALSLAADLELIRAGRAALVGVSEAEGEAWRLLGSPALREFEALNRARALGNDTLRVALFRLRGRISSGARVRDLSRVAILPDLARGETAGMLADAVREASAKARRWYVAELAKGSNPDAVREAYAVRMARIQASASGTRAEGRGEAARLLLASLGLDAAEVRELAAEASREAEPLPRTTLDADLGKRSALALALGVTEAEALAVRSRADHFRTSRPALVARPPLAGVSWVAVAAEAVREAVTARETLAEASAPHWNTSARLPVKSGAELRAEAREAVAAWWRDYFAFQPKA